MGIGGALVCEGLEAEPGRPWGSRPRLRGRCALTGRRKWEDCPQVPAKAEPWMLSGGESQALGSSA